MLRSIVISSLLSLVSFSVFGIDNAMECRGDNPTIIRMQEYFVKSDVRSFISERFAELDIEILSETIEVQIDYTSDFRRMSVYASFLTRKGSEIHLHSGIRGPLDYQGLGVYLNLRLSVQRDREGRIIGRYCNLESRGLRNTYTFVNKTYDDYVVDSGIAPDLFNFIYQWPKNLE
jgi:hypothetical protein